MIFKKWKNCWLNTVKQWQQGKTWVASLQISDNVQIPRPFIEYLNDGDWFIVAMTQLMLDISQIWIVSEHRQTYTLVSMHSVDTDTDYFSKTDTKQSQTKDYSDTDIPTQKQNDFRRRNNSERQRVKHIPFVPFAKCNV